MGSISGSLSEIVVYNLPDDYFAKYSSNVSSLNLDEVKDSAVKFVKPANLIWVVVGDKSKIEEGVKSLGFGEIKYIDGDGNVIE